MRIFALGDIVGENGLKKAREIVPALKKEKNIVKKILKQLLAAGCLLLLVSRFSIR